MATKFHDVGSFYSLKLENAVDIIRNKINK